MRRWPIVAVVLALALVPVAASAQDPAKSPASPQSPQPRTMEGLVLRRFVSAGGFLAGGVALLLSALPARAQDPGFAFYRRDPAEAGTLLILLDTLEELGKAARDGAGWHTCLDGLAAHLDHKNRERAKVAWSEVHAVYAADFGPDATTIGPPEGML